MVWNRAKLEQVAGQRLAGRVKLARVERAALAFARWQGLTDEVGVDTNAAKWALDEALAELDDQGPDAWAGLEQLAARLLGMQIQLAFSQSDLERVLQEPSLGLASAVTDCIVGIPLERNVRKLLHHPHVEGAVQDRLASSGEITPPCDVPAVRATTLPSSIRTGAFSQRSM